LYPNAALKDRQMLVIAFVQLMMQVGDEEKTPSRSQEV
jgi:hypothetical protein